MPSSTLRRTGFLAIVGSISLGVAVVSFYITGWPPVANRWIDLVDYAAQVSPLAAGSIGLLLAAGAGTLLGALVGLARLKLDDTTDEMAAAWFTAGTIGTGLGLILGGGGGALYFLNVALGGQTVLSFTGILALFGLLCLIIGAAPLAVGFSHIGLLSWPEAILFSGALAGGIVPYALGFLEWTARFLPHPLIGLEPAVLLYALAWGIVGTRLLLTSQELPPSEETGVIHPESQ